MKNLNTSHRNAGQSIPEVKKSHKHDANLQKNSTLYFQVGLILCLLGTFVLFEMQFKSTTHKIEETAYNEDSVIEYTMDKYKIYQEPVAEKQEPKVQQKVITDVIKVVENTDPVKEVTKNIVTEVTTPDPVAKVEEIVDPEDVDEPIHINQVEKAPIFPGCEKYTSRRDLHKCMSQKINKLVSKKFNTDIASEEGLRGKQKIHVEFKIDKQGNVKDIKVRAPHHKLKSEAQRVINKIPKMKPGYQGKNPVNVVYNLPIIFQVRD